MILFVCSQARLRSHSARNWAIRGGLDAEACGTDRSAKIPATDSLLRCADKVICFEQKHKKGISKHAHYDENRVYVLGIEDIYDVYDTELFFVLTNRLRALELLDVAQAIELGHYE